ncbi:MAG TPA: hypothetical protein VHX42_04205, partial [Candidatus Babeliales bacterium]|nr:hypothetical protein [Candidatus Babeliales bacterium]
MKKGMSLTVFLMFCSSLDVHTQQFQTLEPSEQCAVIHENLKRNSYFDAPFNQLYERGKRGKRGKRGPRGKRGRSVSSSNCGLNEVLINAPMMCWFGQAILPDALVTPYNNGSAGNTDIPTWTLYASTDFPYNPFVGANFNVPVDLDTTKPVTAVIHMLVDSSDETGDQAKLQVQMDYQPNDGLLGSVVPATGFADTEVSADFT